MGSGNSSLAVLTEDILEEYTMLTYLSKAEIMKEMDLLTKWPSRFCDLIPPDYFLWDYVKAMTYANNPATIDALYAKSGLKDYATSEPAAVAMCPKLFSDITVTLYKTFCKLDETGRLQNLQFRFPGYVMGILFPQLENNPFKDRILKVFSSQKDDKFSFEDTMDLCSVMSDKCPKEVKAAWAFRIFDFDEDNAVGENDLMEAINRLTNGVGQIDVEHQKHIIEILLEEMDIASSGSVGQLEFIHAIGKMSEFPSTFCFRL